MIQPFSPFDACSGRASRGKRGKKPGGGEGRRGRPPNEHIGVFLAKPVFGDKGGGGVLRRERRKGVVSLPFFSRPQACRGRGGGSGRKKKKKGRERGDSSGLSFSDTPFTFRLLPEERKSFRKKGKEGKGKTSSSPLSYTRGSRGKERNNTTDEDLKEIIYLLPRHVGKKG